MGKCTNMSSLWNQTSKLSKQVQNANELFVKEAINSPNLLSDMAAMERYLSESYNGRIFIELLQNSDDSMSSKIILRQIDNDVYYANNGRDFDENDLISICRSGASKKRRGRDIGYRGIGFKSSISLSDEIYIYSGGTYFTFSRKHSASCLNLDEENVPVVRIPFLIDSIKNEHERNIETLLTEGYTTIFVFTNVYKREIDTEIESINKGYFVFLNNISECKIILDKHKSHYLIRRLRNNEVTNVCIDDGSKVEWRIIRDSNSSIAFKIENDRIVPCEASEAKYHCFLPTMDNTPFRFKINADFSTDPSRKHINLDEYTEVSLRNVAYQITNIIKKALEGSKFGNTSQLIKLVTDLDSFTNINLKLQDHIQGEIKNITVKLKNGNILPLTSYKLLPTWLEQTEIDFLRRNSPYVIANSLPIEIYEWFDGVDNFISSRSEQRYSIDDVMSDFTELTIRNEDLEIFGDLLAKIIKRMRISTQIDNENPVSIIDLVKSFENRDTLTSERIKGFLRAQLTKYELDWLGKQTGYEFSDYNNAIEIQETKIEKFSSVPFVTKWRSAEQQILEIEAFFGNIAYDVSRQNLGYDIESTTTTGNKRYIEVKSLQRENSEFSITNNEYACAHQYNDLYYICLVLEKKVIYINNPLKSLKFEKRVRQWEWLCQTFEGEEIPIGYK